VSFNILIIGAGGHARSCIDVIESCGKFNVSGFVSPSIPEDTSGYPYLGDDSDLESLRNKYSYAFIGIGHIYSNASRVSLFNKLKQLEFNLPTFLSPFAHVSVSSNIGSGSIVMPGAIVNSNATVGENSIVNCNALIEHDCMIGNHCHISTSTTINGGVSVMDNCFVGSGSVIKEGLKVSQGQFIKMGSIVTKDVESI